MTIHSSAPVRGVPNARAMDGKPMLTIEASSVVMKIPTHTSATTGAPVAIRFGDNGIYPPARKPCDVVGSLTRKCADEATAQQSHFGASHFSPTSGTA